MFISTDRERVVAGDEEDVEDCGGGQVAGQQAARVGQHRLGVDQRQHEEGDGPHAVEDLQQKIFKLEKKNICNREQFNKTTDSSVSAFV